jgi:hypothetical protein
MPDDGTHKCPADGCTKRVPADMLMCARDWYRVPRPLRAAIWRAWDHGEGAGSRAHTAAIHAAIEAVNRA